VNFLTDCSKGCKVQPFFKTGNISPKIIVDWVLQEIKKKEGEHLEKQTPGL
jgi:hypothetical protein